MNTFGQLYRFTTWGESHGPAVGVVIDGCPAGIDISEEELQVQLDRRRPGQSKVVTQRQESDTCQILSGVFRGKTTGHPISVMVWNKDAQSTKYDEIEDKWRPGHADYVYDKKYGIRDHRGGGRSSAREMIGRVVAGTLAMKILAPLGVRVVAYTRQVGEVVAETTDFDVIEQNPVRCADAAAAEKMVALIEKVRKETDSIGGVLEVVALGVPVGLGDPVYARLDSKLAEALMNLNAAKGVEIGSGFDCVTMRGSEHNDEMEPDGKGGVKFRSNHAGGVLGGISSGQDIVCRVAIKPTASIAQDQATVTRSGEAATIKVEGRHDPCVLPRAIPVAEAMVACVLLDALLSARARNQPAGL
ncbi:MAG: chorismate synthase [Chrysiogenetes bacterium]|nr:chorismate synthase [Chrysiogenetes bacterium]